MARSRFATAGVLALTVALSASGVVAAQDGEPADPITSANGEVSDTLISQDGSLAVYEEHIRALNACDWVGLMAQYPNNVELHMVGDTHVLGREAIGAAFNGFVAPFPQGLCGLTFTEKTRLEVDGTQVVNWEADADFLAEPYGGADAYSSDGKYLVAFVSTFDGSALVYTEEAQAQLDALAAESEAEEEVADEMSEAEEEVADEMSEAEEEVAEAKEEVEEEKEEAKEQASD